jgi:arginyl-tRNA--protein-N-Asp/Glu arginylyltransferase
VEAVEGAVTNDPNWHVVADEPHDCAYLPGRVARMPMRLPLVPLTPHRLDLRLREGDRRAGPLFYRPECPDCTACELLRVPIARFVPTASQRRVWRQNEGQVVSVLQPATATERHVEIYNHHKRARGLARDEGEIDLETYRRYYVESGVPTCEVQYLVGGRMVAFSVLDVGRRGVSSVYHAFDPDEARRSLGTYSVLEEIRLFGARGYEWYYLGLWVGACRSLAYKSRFYPHQRRSAAGWREYAGAADVEGSPVA